MSVVIHSVVNAVHNLITGKTVVNAMREERPPVEPDDGIDYQYGIGKEYDHINAIMEEASRG